MLRYFLVLVSTLWTRLQILREEDRGMTTETVIITGLLAVAAIGALGVIAGAIGRRATRSQTEIEGGLGLIVGLAGTVF